MASLPPALDFPKTEEDICAKWAEEETFKNQDKLALERGDEVNNIMFWSRDYSILIKKIFAVFGNILLVLGDVCIVVKPYEDTIRRAV